MPSKLPSLDLAECGGAVAIVVDVLDEHAVVVEQAIELRTLRTQSVQLIEAPLYGTFGTRMTVLPSDGVDRDVHALVFARCERSPAEFQAADPDMACAHAQQVECQLPPLTRSGVDNKGVPHTDAFAACPPPWPDQRRMGAGQRDRCHPAGDQ